eukprot:m.28076 g.28076  ORF g.28076 m.28076 type:complete len:571 (-) comp11988_c0_seq1:52-1764(-)
MRAPVFLRSPILHHIPSPLPFQPPDSTPLTRSRTHPHPQYRSTMGCTSSKNHEQADATKSPTPAAAPAAEPATATATPAVATATTETNEATTAQVEAAAPGTVATDEQADPENVVVVPDRTSSYSDAVASPQEPQEGDMVFAAYEEEVVTAEQPADATDGAVAETPAAEADVEPVEALLAPSPSDVQAEATEATEQVDAVTAVEQADATAEPAEPAGEVVAVEQAQVAEATEQVDAVDQADDTAVNTEPADDVTTVEQAEVTEVDESTEQVEVAVAAEEAAIPEDPTSPTPAAVEESEEDDAVSAAPEPAEAAVQAPPAVAPRASAGKTAPPVAPRTSAASRKSAEASDVAEVDTLAVPAQTDADARASTQAAPRTPTSVRSSIRSLERQEGYVSPHVNVRPGSVKNRIKSVEGTHAAPAAEPLGLVKKGSVRHSKKLFEAPTEEPGAVPIKKGSVKDVLAALAKTEAAATSPPPRKSVRSSIKGLEIKNEIGEGSPIARKSIQAQVSKALESRSSTTMSPTTARRTPDQASTTEESPTSRSLAQAFSGKADTADGDRASTASVSKAIEV